MPVAVVMHFERATVAHCDHVVETMRLAAGDPSASLCHWVSATDGAIRVTGLWETAEQFKRFAIERIGPITHEVGVPWLTLYDVHGYRAAGPARDGFDAAGPVRGCFDATADAEAA